MTGVLIKRGNLGVEKDPLPRRTPGEIKVDIGMTWEMPKRCQRVPANHPQQGEHPGTEPPSESSDRATSLTPRSWTTSPQN